VSDNPMAFPNTGNSTWNLEPTPGMTLREYYAGKAMEGILAGMLADGSILGKDALPAIAGSAAACADALIAALAARKAPAA
jgi:hypothetical protein